VQALLGWVLLGQQLLANIRRHTVLIFERNTALMAHIAHVGEAWLSQSLAFGGVPFARGLGGNWGYPWGDGLGNLGKDG